MQRSGHKDYFSQESTLMHRRRGHTGTQESSSLRPAQEKELREKSKLLVEADSRNFPGTHPTSRPLCRIQSNSELTLKPTDRPFHAHCGLVEIIYRQRKLEKPQILCFGAAQPS